MQNVESEVTFPVWKEYICFINSTVNYKKLYELILPLD